ncbi:metallophosphoesterase [Metabacillus herbersteinensis]|uniref:Metallophosphoesterase n=1 Tax=Metabacillus herbersteinensis TaxID=283816 RepID=A0ABV6GDF3_9BACI
MIFTFSVIFVLGFFTLVIMFFKAKENNLTRNDLGFSNFPSSFGTLTIFFISDIHRRHLSDKLLNKIDQSVDLVIIGGDLMESGVPFSTVEENVRKLKKIAPTYFVWGNNDYEVDYHKLDSILIDQGVKILDNTAVSFESLTNEKINLLGVDDLKDDRDKLETALNDCSKNGFRILVSHNPDILNKVQDMHKISLILSGHTHGGQIRFFNIGLYEKGRVYKKPQSTILISNGYGTTQLPLRLGAPAEAHLITIRNG